MGWTDASTEFAVVMAIADGVALCWLNLAHVRQEERPLARLWAIHAATRRPFDFLRADDLAGLRTSLVVT